MGAPGFEPGSKGLWVPCSDRLSYAPLPLLAVAFSTSASAWTRGDPAGPRLWTRQAIRSVADWLLPPSMT